VPLDWAAKTTLMKGKGCDKCGGSGYKGRAGLYEVLRNTNKMRQAIMKEASTDEIRDLAISEGTLTLRMDGLKKVERGITTMDEVVKETTAVD
jgi:type IV pilus assembly protein PilB